MRKHCVSGLVPLSFLRAVVAAACGHVPDDAGYRIRSTLGKTERPILFP